MFVVSLTYQCELHEIDAHLPGHIDFLERCYSAGLFLASGRKVPRTGGIILAHHMTRAELEQLLTQDPFHQHNLASYDITEFVPTKTCQPFDFLRQS